MPMSLSIFTNVILYNRVSLAELRRITKIILNHYTNYTIEAVS